MIDLEPYVNKEIPFRFCGEDFRFRLSMGLFSSNAVDAGTVLLLKSLARPLGDIHPVRILDAGCGTGVLGICLKRKYPEAQVVLQDRDSLAVAFSSMNAVLNQTEVETRCALLLETEQNERFELLVSNIPAKAGEPVLKKFFPAAASLLGPGGICAVVIVTTLVPLAEEAIRDNNLEILFKDCSKQHTVFHFRNRMDTTLPPPSLEDYIRNTQKFRLADAGYTLETAWNIPDFDNLGFRLRTAGKVLDKLNLSGDLLFWSPGQGHLPAACFRKGGRKIKSITLAGRDLLELRIASRNIGSLPSAPPPLLCPLPFPEALTENRTHSADLFICDFQSVPGTDRLPALREAALKVIRPGGELLLIGESQEIHRFYRDHKGLSVKQDYRNRGTRVLLLSRGS